MTGLEKIVEQILAEAGGEAEKIRADAKAEADRISADAKAEAEKIKLQSDNRIDMDKANKTARAQSSADLKKRQAILKAKQAIISDVIDKAYNQVLSMDEKEYFDLMLKMLKKYAQGKSGKVFFSEADLKRLPEGFDKKIEAAARENGGALSIAEDSRNLDGGFILNYGGIEENCSFKAIFSSEKEKLADKVNQFLFA